MYSLRTPDKTVDLKHPRVTFHRYYIWTRGYFVITNATRQYITKHYDGNSPHIELKIRAAGVQYCLRLMDILKDWTEFSSHRDGRFHLIMFSMFDMAAVLCTAIIKDADQTMPKRQQSIVAIDNAIDTLKRLTEVSTAARRHLTTF